MERSFNTLFSVLSASNHEATKLLERTSLPGWARKHLFFFLGYVAKADGRVTEQQIRFAESLMRALQLSPGQRQRAIRAFQRGKDMEELPGSRGLRMRLHNTLNPEPALVVMFCLCHATQIEGTPSKQRRYRCEDAVDRTGLPVDAMEIVLNSYASHTRRSRPELRPAPTSYDDACKLLGVHARASLKDIKQAYRRRVSECHPDKLGSGLSDDEYARAKDRLLRYQQAWEIIKKRERARRR
ncbi:molecular chaperone DjlA [Marinobacter halodurans]|uniref:Molecular chaperone DjlA n=1 Tax=Marinobacter halodurans TaxID=2528979 RepID=A0ABY1ZQA7_9GAMM|nr:molecular chaperone DjlA [Marinobacter halodurans]